MTGRLSTIRSAELRRKLQSCEIPARHWSFGHNVTDLHGIESESTFMLYGDSTEYFQKANVEPFARHLECYAKARGMRFVVNTDGLPIHNTVLHSIGASADKDSGWYFSIREEVPQGTADAFASLIWRTLAASELHLLPRVADHSPSLHVNWREPLVWGKIWVMEDELRRMKDGAFLVFWDSDVTIRPDSWHRGIVELLLNRSASRPYGEEIGHVFVADTFPGSECVNSGFTAFRNTEFSRFLLSLWKEKISWAATWNQGSLAETILEIVGLEAHHRTKGRLKYRHTCLPLMLPDMTGVMSYRSYCDCWHKELERLAGRYRQRKSRIVSFVDPEAVAVNFVAHNLFVHHDNNLKGMRLVTWPTKWTTQWLPESTNKSSWRLQKPLTPLAVHWAGIGSGRLKLMREYLRNFGLSIQGCPQSSKEWSDFGSGARQLRCCERFLQTLAEEPETKLEPWSAGDIGCHEWSPVRREDCAKIFGAAWQEMLSALEASQHGQEEQRSD